MSIPEKIKIIIWGKAAGRCHYCNRPIYQDDFTSAEFNSAYIAHIVASRPEGPRGHPTDSERLRTDISNLMLLCDVHHRLIDIEDVDGHPVHVLQKMKQEHEGRVFLQTHTIDNQSHVLLYGAKVGQHDSPLNWQRSFEAMTPDLYPADRNPISIGMGNHAQSDDEKSFWSAERKNLNRNFNRLVRPLIADGHIKHLSIFGLAPQPLLIELGRLVSDLRRAEVYQLHREPTTWRWQDHPITEFKLIPPSDFHGSVALNLSLSADINNDRLYQVLGQDLSIWTITIDNPHNDFLKTKDTLSHFRKCLRTTLNEIKSKHGQNTLLHVFPAMPVSASIELGRVWQPKADMEMKIYDQNRKTGGFTEALLICDKDFSNGD